MKKCFTFLLFSTLVASASSQTGTLDSTFGINGKVVTPIGLLIDQAHAMAIQRDGKIVLAGLSQNATGTDFALARYNINGTLDTTFSEDGKLTTSMGTRSSIAYGVAIQNDGKIVVTGFSNNGMNDDFALARYNTNGTLDVTFGFNGKVSTGIGSSSDEARAIAIQADGKIVVAGRSDNSSSKLVFAMARYNPNGTLDNTFDGDGRVTTAMGAIQDQINAIAIQTDGKIVVTGRSYNAAFRDNFTVARYNINGSLDSTFDEDGKVRTVIGTDEDDANAIAIQSDGKIVVAGGTTEDGRIYRFAVVRYNTDGSLDNTFDGDGKQIFPIGSVDDVPIEIAIQNDGKIVVAGHSANGINYGYALTRLTTTGALDVTFNEDGKAVLDVGGHDIANAMKLSDGRIYVAGSTIANLNQDFSLVAFQNDATALPLFLTSLIAVKQNNFIQLIWKTTNEQNSSVFEVERSRDGTDFSKIGAVSTSGHNMSDGAYSFTDVLFDRQFSTAFYRLKIVDADGKFTYSKVVVMRFDEVGKQLQIFSNPVKDVLNIQATGGNETAILQIIDATGRIIKQQKVQLNGTTSFTIEVGSLEKGNYYLLLNTKHNKQLRPFLKQ